MGKPPFSEKTISYQPVEGPKACLRMYDAREVDLFMKGQQDFSESQKAELRQLRVKVMEQDKRISELKGRLIARGRY